jgi:hypothetical protein
MTRSHITAVVALTIGALTVLGQDVEIQSLSANGSLEWTATVGSDCTVEWASSLTPTAHWQRTWSHLVDIHCTNGSTTAEVPMFYRVHCWTNGLFLRTSAGRTWSFAASNLLGQTWTQHIQSVGHLLMDADAKQYNMLVVYNEHGEPTPGGTTEGGAFFVRSTDSQSFMFQGPGEETVVWQTGTIGSEWTSDGTVIRIDAIEDVTVPAGTFTNCIKFKKWNEGNPSDPWYEWIHPGSFMVKWVDYNVDPTYEPVVYELESYTE